MNVVIAKYVVVGIGIKMKIINVELTGVSELLMNNPISMLEDKENVSGIKLNKIKDLKKASDIKAYKLPNNELYVPAEAIKGCLIGASTFRKIGKFTAKPIIAGGVFISPHKIKLGIKKYEYDIRTGVNKQKGRIVIVRPKIPKWKINFEVEYDETLIGDDKIIKQLLEDGGKRVGILDFRPEKMGQFGRFKITKWQEK